MVKCHFKPFCANYVVVFLVFFSFFYFGCMARQDYFTHSELSQSIGGVKMGDP